MEESRLALALNKLDELGFRPSKRIGTARCFDGELQCAKGPVKIRLMISDWEFTTLPTIVLLERPAYLPALTPHVSGEGFQCYFVHGRIVLDRYRPDNAIWQCVEQAKQEIDRLSTSSRYREQEFGQEFAANWEIGQNPAPIPVLLGEVSGSGPFPCMKLEGASGTYLLVASNEGQIEALSKTCNWSVPERISIGSYVVQSAELPKMPKDRLPRTVTDVLVWIRSWDRKVTKQIHSILGQREWLNSKWVQFLISTPAGWFGFLFQIDSNRSLMCRRVPTRYRQYLYSNGEDVEISRVSARQISPEFIHSRNLLVNSLRDKRIKLIGCGAIGGYLAQSLVRLGAGTGSGGLTLIDPDVLVPGNLGRHFLGMDYLYRSKSEALSEALVRQFPYAQLLPEPRSANLPSDIAGDLVIDATGEEAVSEAVNAKGRSVSQGCGVPVLHTWIVGNGQCVQALWVDKPKFACFRCMRCMNDERAKRFPILEEEPETRMVGCSAYTPYAVSAPMSASALATDMIIDWMKGDVSPRFRTRAVEGANARTVKNQNVKPLKGCPGCEARLS